MTVLKMSDYRQLHAGYNPKPSEPLWPYVTMILAVMIVAVGLGVMWIC